MKAAILQEFKKPLVLEDVPEPKPGPGEVLIKVEACGVCHSDLHVAEGDWPQFARITKIPLILGHEIAGRVTAVGDTVHDLAIGDRVGVPWIYWTCGECESCREGNENLCSKQQITGVTIDGGYAEFVKAPVSHTEKIPPELSAIEAAPIFCAGVTVYRALSQSRILAGQRLAVFGVGGLGQFAIQIGVGLGAQVTAVDISEEKLATAAALGAVLTLNASATNIVKEFRSAGSAHVAIVTSAAKAAYDTAFGCLRPRGTLLVVGLPSENICFPAIKMVGGEVHIQGSTVGTRKDLKEVLAMAAAGKLRCQISTRPLAQVNEVLEELRQGKIAGRVALTPQ